MRTYYTARLHLQERALVTFTDAFPFSGSSIITFVGFSGRE